MAFGSVGIAPLTKAFGLERLLKLLGPVGGTVPNLEDDAGDVVAVDVDDAGAPKVFNNALGMRE